MSLQVRAYSPQLLREYPSNVGGEGGVRRAPIILVELTDAHLEQVGLINISHITSSSDRCLNARTSDPMGGPAMVYLVLTRGCSSAISCYPPRP